MADETHDQPRKSRGQIIKRYALTGLAALVTFYVVNFALQAAKLMPTIQDWATTFAAIGVAMLAIERAWSLNK